MAVSAQDEAREGVERGESGHVAAGEVDDADRGVGQVVTVRATPTTNGQKNLECVQCEGDTNQAEFSPRFSTPEPRPRSRVPKG